MLEGFGQESPNWVAVAQQVALIQSLYAGSEEYARSLLDAGEELIVFERRRNTWPPSFLCVRKGDNYFVAIEGTTNNGQFVGHIPGIWLREDYLGDSSVHGGWWDASRTLRQLLPSMAAGNWYFSGHSYGGAVAAILSMEMAESRGSAVVELMTFGAPMHMTNGYRGPLPSPYWRFEATSDLVPSTPPNGLELFGTVWRNPINWVRTDWFFWEYGSGQVLNPIGEVNGRLTENRAEGPLNVIGFPGSHYLSNYWGRLNARMNREGNPSENLLAWMAIARQGFNLESYQIPAQLPQQVAGPNGEILTIPTDWVYLSGGGEMSVYQVSIVFVGKNQRTWRESHAVNATSAMEAASKMNRDSVLTARAAFLSGLYSIRAIEAVNLQNPRDGVVQTANKQGSNLTADGETAGVAVSIGAYLTEGYPQRWAPVRGFPDAIIKFDENTGAQLIIEAVQTAIREWYGKLQVEGFGSYVRFREDPADPTLSKNYLVSLNGDTSPGLTIVTTAVPVNLGAATMASLHLRGEDTIKALPGLNGAVLPVLNVAGATFTIPYTIPRGGSLAPGEKSYMRPARYEFAAYQGAVELGQNYARRTRRLK